MKKVGLILLMTMGCLAMFAQNPNPQIRKGNKLYKNNQFKEALPEYEKAVQINPDNPIGNFNYGNALFRNGSHEEAEKRFDMAIAKSDDNAIKQQAYYNKGVSLTKQKKLEESIEAYKGSVKLNPDDVDARHNLQKALLELKKKNESQEQKEQKKQQKPKEKSKPQQSKLNKKQVEQLLRALRQREQEVQQKMQQNKQRSVSQPEKDW